jgi:hypothetical protein
MAELTMFSNTSKEIHALNSAFDRLCVDKIEAFARSAIGYNGH